MYSYSRSSSSPSLGNKRGISKVLYNNVHKALLNRETNFKKIKKPTIFDSPLIYQTAHYVTSIINNYPNILLYSFTINDKNSIDINIFNNLDLNYNNYFAQIEGSDGNNISFHVEGTPINSTNTSIIFYSSKLFSIYTNATFTKLYFFNFKFSNNSSTKTSSNNILFDSFKNNYNIKLLSYKHPDTIKLLKHFNNNSNSSSTTAGSSLNNKKYKAFLSKKPLSKLQSICKNKNLSFQKIHNNTLIDLKKATLIKKLVKFYYKI